MLDSLVFSKLRQHEYREMYLRDELDEQDRGGLQREMCSSLITFSVQPIEDNQVALANADAIASEINIHLLFLGIDDLDISKAVTLKSALLKYHEKEWRIAPRNQGENN